MTSTLAYDSRLTHQVIGLAITVHRTLGPGLLESIYEECLSYELDQANLPYDRQRQLPVVYRDSRLEAAFRADIIVASDLLLEIKSVEHLLPLHEAQILTYLRLSGCHVGLLMNFNSVTLKEGLRRFVR